MGKGRESPPPSQGLLQIKRHRNWAVVVSNLSWDGNGSQYMCFRLNLAGRQTCCSSSTAASSQNQAAFEPHGSGHVDSTGEDTSLSTGPRTVSRGPVWLAHGYTIYLRGSFVLFSEILEAETPHSYTPQHPRKASPHPSPSAWELNGWAAKVQTVAGTWKTCLFSLTQTTLCCGFLGR